MDFQAVFKANKCLGLRKKSRFSKDIDFEKPINENPGDRCRDSHTTENGFRDFWSEGIPEMVFVSGYQKQFQSKAVFTKKESGWQVVEIILSKEALEK